MTIKDFIDNKIDKVKNISDEKVLNLSDEFIYAYGPYMVMHAEWMGTVDEISRNNPIMRLLAMGAGLISTITSGISYKNAKLYIRDFIIKIEKEFPSDGHNEEQAALRNMAIMYLKGLRDHQHENYEMESAMTSYAPIVPYDGVIRKQEIEEEGEEATSEESISPSEIIITNKLKKCMDYAFNDETDKKKLFLQKLLCKNLYGILMNYNECTTCLEQEGSEELDFTKLDKLLYRYNHPSDIEAYYFLATINYYKVPVETFNRYFSFFKGVGDFSKFMSYKTFESIVEDMAKCTSYDISLESLDDAYISERGTKLVDENLAEYGGDQHISSKDSFMDLNQLLSYVNSKRYIRTDSYTQQLFTTLVNSPYQIEDVNFLESDRVFYEIRNTNGAKEIRFITCPYMDMRSYLPKLAYIRSDSEGVIVSEIDTFATQDDNTVRTDGKIDD